MSIEQLQQWLKPGVLGFYQSCEVTICGLLDRNDTVHNLFTLFSFESQSTPQKIAPHFLTRKNEHFGQNLCLIVVQYRTSIEGAVKAYEEIVAGEKKINTPLGSLNIFDVTEIPPIFAPIDSTQTILLNRVLKNNFCGGSMVLEWFGSKDYIYGLLEEKYLQQVLLRICELLPIDLFSLSDRIGNVLFQLPSHIAFCHLSGSEHDTICTICFDERSENLEKYIVTTMTDIDHVLMGFQLTPNSNKREWEITLNETGGPYIITVIDSKYQIPIMQQTTSTMRAMSSIVTFRGDLDCMRTICIGEHTENITVNSSERVTVGRPEYPWKAAMQQRRYQKRMKELAQNREFVRYGKAHSDRDKGLCDLRALMNATVDTRVCLWDPYLNAKDLLETWYFTDTFGLELRAITSSEIQKSLKISLDEWKDEQRKTLLAGSNQYGINIQWRVQHDLFGFSFHDRFLILLPPEGETPKAWSLGTSVNSFGKTHHILQQVSNPGHVIDAFEELWEALSDPSCQIWNSKEV